MAPQPDNDNTPKAPDKTKGDKHGNSDFIKEKNKDFKTVNNLNDCELKDLLDEAITYKNPKDREGKSSLFKELLSQAEESERNARAASAGGSEQVRYCNTSARRSKHRRKPNSISENVMHGGSLDNLAKEDLFEVVHHLSKPKRTVSARQREGGSLPSNVNAGSLASYDPHFLEEARRKRTVRGGGPPEPMDVDMETASLLDHDSVAENYEKGAPAEETVANHGGAPKYTTKATLQVNVDDALHFKDLDHMEKKPDIEQISAKVLQTKYSVYIQDYGSMTEAQKKVDENGNALHQNAASKGKKKKVQAEKNVMSSYSAEKLEGHRGDIINDVDKLVEFIGDGGAQNKNSSHRQKQLHKNAADVGGKGGKKQRGGAQSSKANNKETTTKNELKKSNSLEEVSTTKLDGFEEDNKEGKSRRAKEEGDNKDPPKAKEDNGDKTRPKVKEEGDKAKSKEESDSKAKSKEEGDSKTRPKAKEDVDNKSPPKTKEEGDLKARSKGKGEEDNKIRPKAKEEGDKIKPKTKDENEKSKPKAKEEGDNKAPPKESEKAAPKVKEEGDNKIAPKAKIEAVQVKPKQSDVRPERTSKSDTSCVDKLKEKKPLDNAESKDQTEASSTDFFHVVTKKKKTKKPSLSLTTGPRTGRPTYSGAPPGGHVFYHSATAQHPSVAAAVATSVSAQRRRTSSPPRRKSVCSVPQSDKSNDSSDVDSVHSLPAEGSERRRNKGNNAPAQVSYAAIAKNASCDGGGRREAPPPPPPNGRRQFSDARVGGDSPGERSGSPKWASQPSVERPIGGTAVATVNVQTQTTPPRAAQQQPPPDVHNFKSFPTISKAIGKAVGGVAPKQSPQQMARPVVQQQQQQRVQVESGARGVSGYPPETPPHLQQQQRDLKTDLSIIQANEMETVQYNSQMMPGMEIPDCQTIEKLNYMNQPGAHMPPHLQHHVVPPQHLHMAMPPPQQRSPAAVNQPPPPPPAHITVMMQQQPPPPSQNSVPEIYHPQPVYNAPAQTTVVAHHHHHHHHHPPHHPLAFPPQAYEGVAVAYVDPAYLREQHPQQQQLQAGGMVLSHHHHHQQSPQQQQMPPVIMNQQQHETPNREKAGKWSESDPRARTKQQQPSPPQQAQRRYDRNHAHADRRRETARFQQGSATSPQQHHHHHHQQTYQAVTLYRRDGGARRGGARTEQAASACSAPPRGDAPPPPAAPSAPSNCDSNETTTTNASNGEDAQGADRPPVVILSGAPRDVPGIEFGFAVNPDLVEGEDDEEEEEEEEAAAMGACEMFERFFRPPAAGPASDACNHDKVVRFLDSAWNDAISSGKAKYYSPSN